MRGQRYKSIIAENLMAVNPEIVSSNAMNLRKKMCWKCQKDKSPIDGHIKTFKGGPMKFICKECKVSQRKTNA